MGHRSLRSMQLGGMVAAAGSEGAHTPRQLRKNQTSFGPADQYSCFSSTSDPKIKSCRAASTKSYWMPLRISWSRFSCKPLSTDMGIDAVRSHDGPAHRMSSCLLPSRKRVGWCHELMRRELGVGEEYNWSNKLDTSGLQLCANISKSTALLLLAPKSRLIHELAQRSRRGCDAFELGPMSLARRNSAGCFPKNTTATRRCRMLAAAMSVVIASGVARKA